MRSRKKINDGNKRIPDTTGLIKKSDYNARITEIERKIPSNAGLAATAALNVVENKIPTTNLDKKGE